MKILHKGNFILQVHALDTYMKGSSCQRCEFRGGSYDLKFTWDGREHPHAGVFLGEIFDSLYNLTLLRFLFCHIRGIFFFLI